ncbi:unnamed protein product [Cyberlindnera jadinii]|uniref:Uncharacterized protein n=1 Tax=Cyberlindnera jadinii (strain ATCC 18201 / CBS 1600 / BCRC 20928 / JCM 3617 / NBRC 0987 / NRRL Y-1542) TaxID=983966 RepID=A0A0H5C041_CYBJN|nr:unnamed protein product [Cyberlindnera jadinii]
MIQINLQNSFTEECNQIAETTGVDTIKVYERIDTPVVLRGHVASRPSVCIIQNHVSVY